MFQNLGSSEISQPIVDNHSENYEDASFYHTLDSDLIDSIQTSFYSLFSTKDYLNGEPTDCLNDFCNLCVSGNWENYHKVYHRQEIEQKGQPLTQLRQEMLIEMF